MLRGGIGILIWLYIGLALAGLAGMVWRQSLEALDPGAPVLFLHHVVVGLAGGGLLVLLSRVSERYIASVEALTQGTEGTGVDRRPVQL